MVIKKVRVFRWICEPLKNDQALLLSKQKKAGSK
jgi:hypothetical protein